MLLLTSVLQNVILLRSLLQGPLGPPRVFGSPRDLWATSRSAGGLVESGTELGLCADRTFAQTPGLPYLPGPCNNFFKSFFAFWVVADSSGYFWLCTQKLLLAWGTDHMGPWEIKPQSVLSQCLQGKRPIACATAPAPVTNFYCKRQLSGYTNHLYFWTFSFFLKVHLIFEWLKCIVKIQ